MKLEETDNQTEKDPEYQEVTVEKEDDPQEELENSGEDQPQAGQTVQGRQGGKTILADPGKEQEEEQPVPEEVEPDVRSGLLDQPTACGREQTQGQAKPSAAVNQLNLDTPVKGRRSRQKVYITSAYKGMFVT